MWTKITDPYVHGWRASLGGLVVEVTRQTSDRWRAVCRYPGTSWELVGGQPHYSSEREARAAARRWLTGKG